MSKEKITLTLDAASLRELRALVGARSLSETVDKALVAHLARLRHLKALGEWLGELEREHGPVRRDTAEWASRLVDEWQGHAERRRRAG